MYKKYIVGIISIFSLGLSVAVSSSYEIVPNGIAAWGLGSLLMSVGCAILIFHGSIFKKQMKVLENERI